MHGINFDKVAPQKLNLNFIIFYLFNLLLPHKQFKFLYCRTNCCKELLPWSNASFSPSLNAKIGERKMVEKAAMRIKLLKRLTTMTYIM